MKEIPKIDKPLYGEITLQGDKSVSFRAILLGPLAPGTRVCNLASTPLIQLGIGAIETLGAGLRDAGADWMEFTGYADGIHSAEIDCGSSATLMRLTAGLLAGRRGNWRLTADEQLAKRPMERIADPLGKMGAVISTREGYPPVDIIGGGLNGIEYELPVPSAQVKSAILLAGLNADGVTVVREATPTRDHTERMLSAMGARIDTGESSDGDGITIEGGHKLQPLELFIPGDISSAAFIIALAGLIPGSEVTITDVLLNERRTSYLNHLRKMGVEISVDVKNPANYEPYGDIIVRGSGELRNAAISESEAAGMIDEIPLLAMAGAFAEGRFELTGAGELRVKETDRIGATAHNLRAMGLDIDEYEDGFSFAGGGRLNSCAFESFGDHRLAMACYVAGCRIGGCSLSGWDAASASFPGFEGQINKLRGI